MSTFDIEETIQSQYADSPHLKALVNSFWKALDPEADIEKLYNDMINLDTAVGFGLDVWGRIVAIGREYISVDEDSKYWGFEPLEGVTNDRLDTFDNAPFYEEINGKVRLTDEAYRTYILIKAMINIGDSTLASINRMMASLFPDVEIYCIHVDTMVLRIVIQSEISEADKTALLRLPWLPAGVGLELYQVVTPTFGFDGSGLHPFDCGTFQAYEIISV